MPLGAALVPRLARLCCASFLRFHAMSLLCPSVSHLPPLFDLQDSTLIMQLLRDNLTLWTSDMQVRLPAAALLSLCVRETYFVTSWPQEEGGDAQGGDDGQSCCLFARCSSIYVCIRDECCVAPPHIPPLLMLMLPASGTRLEDHDGAD